MTKSSTLETISSSQQSRQANQRLKLSMTHSGTMCGQNIQLQFCGPTHIGKKNSMNMANISLANSLQVSTSPLILSLTKLPRSSFMDAKNYPLLTSINLPSSPTKSFCPENDEEAGLLTATPQAPAKALVAEKTRGNDWEVIQSLPSAMSSTKQPASAPTVPQAVTPNPIAHAKQGRVPMNDLELRGKRP